MHTPARCLLSLLLLLSWLLLAGRAQAVYPPPVKDGGKFFSEEGLRKANQKIRAIYANYKRDVVVETFEEVPPEVEKKLKTDDRKELFSRWARERSEELGVNGVYIQVCRKPGHVQVEISEATAKAGFSSADRDALVSKLLADFRKKEFDQGLLDGLELIDKAFKSKK